MQKLIRQSFYLLSDQGVTWVLELSKIDFFHNFLYNNKTRREYFLKVSSQPE